MDTISRTFWNNTSAALRKQNLTWEWLAQTIDCNNLTLLSKKSHYCTVSFPLAVAISKALNVSMEKLAEIELTDDTPKSEKGTADDRIEVFNNTQSIIEKGEYTVGDMTINLESPPKSIYNYKEIANSARKLITDNNTIIEVVSADCLELASKLVNENPLVLNMANRYSPDYAVTTGSSTQEAYILRCSNYSQTLFSIKERAYPIGYDHGFIYSKDVTVFKDTEENGYKLLANPFKISIVAVTPLYKPVIRNGEYLEADHQHMVKKIKSIFNCAIRYKHQVLILGALGCETECNPPALVAKVFREVLTLPEYRNQFEKIFFSITNKKARDEFATAFF